MLLNLIGMSSGPLLDTELRSDSSFRQTGIGACRSGGTRRAMEWFRQGEPVGLILPWSLRYGRSRPVSELGRLQSRTWFRRSKISQLINGTQCCQRRQRELGWPDRQYATFANHTSVIWTLTVFVEPFSSIDAVSGPLCIRQIDSWDSGLEFRACEPGELVFRHRSPKLGNLTTQLPDDATLGVCVGSDGDSSARTIHAMPVEVR